MYGIDLKLTDKFAHFYHYFYDYNIHALPFFTIESLFSLMFFSVESVDGRDAGWL
jgi:hypothetical protein